MEFRQDILSTRGVIALISMKKPHIISAGDINLLSNVHVLVLF